MDILWYHIRVWQVVGFEGWLQCEIWNDQCTFFTVTLKSMGLSYNLNESLTYAWFCSHHALKDIGSLSYSGLP